MKSLAAALLVATLGLAAVLTAQRSQGSGQGGSTVPDTGSPTPGRTTFEARPSLVFGNDKLELIVAERGASLFSVEHLADTGHINPLWNPARMNRDLGLPAPGDNGFGHFICLDGFGPSSAAERTAGIQFHGEAIRQDWQILSFRKQGQGTELTLQATLPLVQESIWRTIRLVEGESVVYFLNELRSNVAFDRPISWAEHTTIGAPFLAAGTTTSSVSGTRAQNKPYQGVRSGDLDRRLASAQSFTWPMSPGRDGQLVDLTTPPVSPHFVDHATVLVDPALTYGWIASVNPAQRLIIGYVFRRSDFPWIMSWGSYPAAGNLARGLEFSTQPYDVSHQDAVALNGMFEAPTFRWLPARGAIQANFIMFYAPTPAAFGKVRQVTLSGGQLTIEDVSGGRMTLAASQQW